MDSVTKENTVDVSLHLSVEALQSGKDVLAVLPTAFGKSIIHQSFFRSGKIIGSFIVHLVCCPTSKNYRRPVTIQWLRLKSSCLGKIKQLLKAVGANKYHVIFASAEQALSAEFTALFIIRDESSESKRNFSFWGTLGFSVLRFSLFFRSVFRFLCQKTSAFRF